jgi:tryptophan-rich sensory protein
MDLLKLIICILVCQIIGLLGSLFNIKAIPGWYSKQKKPSFNPPNWIFGPVWTALYLLMGISLYLVLISGKETTIPIIIFSIQLFLNLIWTGIFFGMKKPLLAFTEIILLWISIAINIFVFYGISRVASYLLIPYILWVSFASILNFSIWWLNRKKPGRNLKK